MQPAEGTPYAQNAPTRELAQLRLRAEHLVRTENDEDLLAIGGQLRTDDEQWPHLWARHWRSRLPARTTACPGPAQRRHSGGFAQPELFEGLLEHHFADNPQGASGNWP